jgi:hypothetical protein
VREALGEPTGAVGVFLRGAGSVSDDGRDGDVLERERCIEL